MDSGTPNPYDLTGLSAFRQKLRDLFVTQPLMVLYLAQFGHPLKLVFMRGRGESRKSYSNMFFSNMAVWRLEMGAKYSYGVWEQFADQASTILVEKYVFLSV